MRVFLERAGHAQCLIHTPNGDFDRQLSYDYEGSFAQLPELRSNDTLHLRCQYDNSPSNRALMRELNDRGLEQAIEEASFVRERQLSLQGSRQLKLCQAASSSCIARRNVPSWCVSPLLSCTEIAASSSARCSKMCTPPFAT
jgi:hypothetical protein